MPLPPAVRQRADNARKMARSALTGLVPEEQTQAAPDVEQGVTPEPAAEVPVADPAPTPQAQPESPPEPKVEAKPEQRPGFIDPTDWENRYKALRTARDERRHQVQAENASLKDEVEALREQLKRRETPEKPKAEAFKLDDETRERIGETEAKVIDQLSDNTARQVKELRAELEAERSANQKRATVAREQFFEELDTLAPSWRELNGNREFLSWLSEVDPSTGEQRQAVLNGIVDNNDAPSAARLFKSYAQGMASGQQPLSGGVSPEPTVNRPSGQLGAEEQMVEVYSPDEVKDFFERKSSLYRAGRLRQAEVREQVAAEEAKIRSAIAEGRVR